MSSTSRGYDRHASDYYITPVHTIVNFLKTFIIHDKYFESLLKSEQIILDASAGGDKKNKMSYPEALKFFGVNESKIRTIDIRKDSRAEIKADYLKYELDFKPSIIITNPPFLLARQFIDKALNDVADHGYVIMLLRLNFFGGQKRKELWDKQMPKYSFVHSKRISFTDNGKTDSIEYQHCVWQKNHYPSFTSLKVI